MIESARLTDVFVNEKGVVCFNIESLGETLFFLAI